MEERCVLIRVTCFTFSCMRMENYSIVSGTTSEHFFLVFFLIEERNTKYRKATHHWINIFESVTTKPSKTFYTVVVRVNRKV